jgi:AIR synthase-related protein
VTDVLALLGDTATLARRPPFTIEPASIEVGEADSVAYRALRRQVFVEEQGLFDGHDLDDADEDPRTVVLVARDRSGEVIGGVRLGPADPGGPDVGWWRGGRLAVARPRRRGGAPSDPRAPRAPGAPRAPRAPGAPRAPASRVGVTPYTQESAGCHTHQDVVGAVAAGAVGAALVRAACAYAVNAGVLRFEATVQLRAEAMFARLGWVRVRPVSVAGHEHVLMRWPIGRIAGLAGAAKGGLGSLVRGLAGVPGFTGDDGVPVPGSDLVAACDAIVPSMVERDPEWAGWCSVLVNVNDLSAMGASPVGLLDALGARDRSFAARVLSGLRRASDAYGVPVLGGHTQLGVPASLAVTALGRTADPVPGGGGAPGDRVWLTADLGGGWRRGYTGRQWDSTTHRSRDELRAMIAAVGASRVAAARPAAAKDVSMAGIAGTLGMMAEASGCGAVLDVAAVPRPAGASVGDWLTCFPGFGMLTAGASLSAGPAVSASCGSLVAGAGVRLRWPDGEETVVIDGAVTGLGVA